VVQRFSGGYVFDPEDPRAPTREQWALMTPVERDRIVDMLPTDLPIDVKPPEGDAHRKAKQGALGALDDFFRRAGRRIYLSSELIVFYPGERSFVPDLLAVLDVDAHDRTRWISDVEGKGLDLVLEVHVAGERGKDLEVNVERYARLGIHEYFVFDRARLRLHGYRLSAANDSERSRPGTYQRIVPQAGHFASVVLGLDLVLDGDRLRFFAGNAPLEDADEVIARLGTMLDKVIAREEELSAKLEEERRLREEERRLREEADRLLAEARAEIARLKGA
jgi:Uma2 family endonuclease